jgi:hypothetical protein
MTAKEKLALIESLCRQVDSAQLRLGAEDPDDHYIEIGLGEVARRLRSIARYLKQVTETKGEGQ